MAISCLQGMINSITSFFAIITIIIITSCGTDNRDEEITQKIAGNSLVGKSWSVSNIEIDLGTVTPKDCVSDNNFTYFESGRYEVNEGTTKCASEDPPGLVGDWFINDDNSEITIQIGDSTRIWTIIDIQSASHMLSSSFDGDLRTYTFLSN